MSVAAVAAVVGMLVMHGLPLPGAAAFHLGMTMDRPVDHSTTAAMSHSASISAAGVMAGPHNCVPDGPRMVRLVLPPATAGPMFSGVTHASVTLAAFPVGALARASPSLDRLCVSRQ